MVEERSQDDQHDALRALHETDLALTDESLGAGARIADHQGSDHHKGHQHNVAEAVDATVVDQQSKEQHHIRVAINHRIEKGAEDGNLIRAARHAAVYHIEDASAKDDHAGEKEHAPRVGGIGVPKEKGGHDIDDQANECKYIRRNAGQRESTHNTVE